MMQRIAYLFLFLALGLFSQPLLAQKQKSPKSTFKTLVKAAKTGRFGLLANLCDPENAGDGDTKRICALANPDTEASEKDRDEFRQAIGKAKLSGKIELLEEEGIYYARVPFTFTHPRTGKSGEETMNMVKRGEKWYLSSF